MGCATAPATFARCHPPQACHATQWKQNQHFTQFRQTYFSRLKLIIRRSEMACDVIGLFDNLSNDGCCFEVLCLFPYIVALSFKSRFMGSLYNFICPSSSSKKTGKAWYLPDDESFSNTFLPLSTEICLSVEMPPKITPTRHFLFSCLPIWLNLSSNLVNKSMIG